MEIEKLTIGKFPKCCWQYLSKIIGVSLYDTALAVHTAPEGDLEW